MARRLKTIEFAFDSLTASVATDVLAQFAQITIYLPETKHRRFVSVILEATCRTSSATAISFTSAGCGISTTAGTGGTGPSLGDTVASTEHQTVKLRGDVTSFFAGTQLTDASFTLYAAFICSGPATINHTCKLIFTYEFEDDGAATRIKTVRIPLVGSPSVLSTTFSAIGAVPILTGGATPFLPEASVVIRDLFYQIECNEASTATTDFQFGFDVDSGTEHLDGLHEQALNSSLWYRYIWRQPSQSTTVTHTLNMRSTVASRGGYVQAFLVVTYEYAVAGTTRTINHRVMPFAQTDPAIGSQGQAVRLRFKIAEPGTITARTSGSIGWFDQATSANVNWHGGLGTHQAGTQTCGCYAVSGIETPTIAAGWNTIDLQCGNASGDNATACSNMSGIYFLNFESDVFAAGPDAHTASVAFCSMANDVDSICMGTAQTKAVAFPEPYYWLDHAGFVLDWNVAAASAAVRAYLIGASTDPVDRTLVATNRTSDSTLGCSVSCADTTRHFKRHPSDGGHDLIDVENARSIRYFTSTASWRSSMTWATYCPANYYVADSVTGYTGDGSGVTVEVFDPDDRKVGSDVTIVGGAYAVPVYDGRANYYAVARQDSTHVGRSDDLTPSQTVTVNRDGP